MCRGKSCDFAPCEDGAALLEFALILPVLLVLCIGCVEIGRVLYAYSAVESAVRGGARFLAQVPNPGCVPTCSWGALHAVALTRDQIAANTGIRETAIRITPFFNSQTNTVMLEAEVDVDSIFSGGFGRVSVWTVKVTKQEQKIAG